MPASKKSNIAVNVTWYVLSDYLAALLTSMIFHFSRRILLSEAIFVNHQLLLTNRFWLGCSTIPVGWLILYALTGAYTSLYKKSRLNEITNTFICSIIGCTIIFFAIVINDPVKDYHYFYKTYFIFLSAQFVFTLIGRMIVLNITRKQVEMGKVVFNTLLIGSNSVATRIYKDSLEGLRSSGYHYAGYVSNDN